jgi:hypothetical protein
LFETIRPRLEQTEDRELGRTRGSVNLGWSFFDPLAMVEFDRDLP